MSIKTGELNRLNLSIAGMHCASCVERVEKALSRLEGVKEVSVNLATETASIYYTPGIISLPDLIRVIESLGYKVLSSKEILKIDQEKALRENEIKCLRQKFIAGIILIIPIFFLMLNDHLRLFTLIELNHRTNFFLQFLFQTPIQFGIGWQFYKGAWIALKYKPADMNTLTTTGTSAAYLS
ncbi:MAG: cation transporter, partial [Desulfobacterota bacterium]|nr:cation transporter [Thermodesulfobacteriota bacterium]